MARTRPEPKIGGRMREIFDHTRDFIVLRNGRINGVEFQGGSIFDKSLVPARRLRQMYEGRWLKLAPEGFIPKVASPHLNLAPIKPDFKLLSAEGLRQWLVSNGKIPRPRLAKDKLLELAEVKWVEMNSVSSPH